MKYIKLIEALSNAHGPSGFEDQVIEVAKSFLDKSLDVKIDNMLNVEITPKNFDENKPYFAVDAHLDEVGMIVQSIKPNGHISIVTLGAWDLRNLLSQNFIIQAKDGKKIKAVVSTVPPHFTSEKRELSQEDINLDVGASSAEEVRSLGIDLGSPISPDTNFYFDKERGIMMGKAFDDRLGCSLVVSVMNSAAELGITQIKGILSTQEEMGLRGAGVVAGRLNANRILCFEGAPADDTLVSPDLAQGALGKGPQIRLMDRTSISYPKWINEIRDIGDSNSIKYQISVRRGGGTNMGMYQHTEKTIPTAVFGVPVRYIHTNMGISKYEDFESTYDLAMAIISKYSEVKK